MDEITQLQQNIIETINELQICPSGQVLGEDYECHQECGSGTYCASGQCFNGKCISCPTGTYLATDGKCYAY